MKDTQDSIFTRHSRLEMWRHYDTMRQSKNSAFMTANSILVGIAGLVFKEVGPVELFVVSLFGITVCVSWFLLLTRNAAYIKYHRTAAGCGDENFWMPETRMPRSKTLDRVPLGAFTLFWLGILVFSVVRVIK